MRQFNGYEFRLQEKSNVAIRIADLTSIRLQLEASLANGSVEFQQPIVEGINDVNLHVVNTFLQWQ